jgi:glycosyltransferase involved in cell wall biosynthesis
MDYLIEEVARLPQPRPFLQLVGAMDEHSPTVLALAERLLGRDGCRACSVPCESVFDFYRAADVFVLASLQEGFGRVFLEALSHGLPVLAHRHPVMEFVLGSEGTFGDLSQPGQLSDLLKQALARPLDRETARHRWESVRARFSWPVLAPAYREMFASAATRPLPAPNQSVR